MMFYRKMKNITRVLLIFLPSLLLCITCNKFNDVRETWLPHLSKMMGTCADYFHYQRIDDFINGKLTLSNMKVGDNVKMTFYRLDFPYRIHFDGIFLPDVSSEEVINRLGGGQPISFRVDFPLVQNVPELINIFINEKELCSTKRNKSLEMLVLQYKFNIVNDSLPVFTYNINIPEFVESPNCGLVDMNFTNPMNTQLTNDRGATVTSRGEYPWLTAIYKKQTVGINFLCGGSLITSKFIVTAAHCFQRLTAAKIIAILGRYNLTNYVEDDYVIHEIEELILHPEYRPEQEFSDADLAILKMMNHVSFTKFIKPICLWTGSAEESLFATPTGIVVGWDRDKVGEIESVVPKIVKIDIVSQNECKRSSPEYDDITSSRILCARIQNGSGLCEGDFGGGLMINKYGRWILRGLISPPLSSTRWRCDMREYTVYSDVTKHILWLNNYIGKQVLRITGVTANICGISGTESRTKHPWIVAIYKKTLTGVIFLCTGALISSQSILAPASCFVIYKSDYLRVYLGRYDLNSKNENGVAVHDVASIIFHPDFKDGIREFYDNNIALLQVETPISFTQFIKPICLWSEPTDGRLELEGQAATIYEWDFHEIYENGSTVPQFSDVNIVSAQQCQSSKSNTSASLRILCVPRIRKGILMLKRDGRWLLRGVSTLSLYFASNQSQDFWEYSDIAASLPWIQTNVLP